MNRLLAALVAYAAIAVLAWFTLSGDKLRFFGGSLTLSPRDLVVVLMAALAFLSIVNHYTAKQRERLDKRDDS